MTDALVQRISEKYYAEREAKSKAQEKPVIVFIGARPGAGKSAAAKMARRELAQRSGYIHVDVDRMREEIPIGDYKPPSHETQADTGKLASALRTLAVEGRRNVIMEGAFRLPGVMAYFAKGARDQGYGTEFIAVATHGEESLLGVYERFEKQHLNPALNPRFVSEEFHESALAGFTDNLEKDSGAFDRTRVVTRDVQTGIQNFIRF